MYNGTATGNTKWYAVDPRKLLCDISKTDGLCSTSTANTEKHAIEYKGIDLLTIRKGTLQVEKVMTSAVSCLPLPRRDLESD